MSEPKSLVLEDGAQASIAAFLATVFDQVPATITRAQVLETLCAFQDTYDRPDIDRRVALLADDCEIEDPAGLPRGGGKVGMEAFFRSTFDNGVRIHRRPIERIVVGNEAIERNAMMLEKDGLEPHPVAHVVHYRFDDRARIRSMRVFFDRESIFRQPHFDGPGAG